MTYEKPKESYPYRPEMYRAYDELFVDINQRHPQRQGLLEEEYRDQLADNRTVTTPVETAEGLIEVPQLAPIECFEWLNTEKYQADYPTEVAQGRLQYFTEVPGVHPGDKVLEGIMELAHSGGVLAFDTPSCDPEAQARTLEMLDSMGIAYQEPELLGTQTYFAGGIKLKRPHQKLEHPRPFRSAYGAKVESGDYNPDSQNGVVLKSTVSQDVADYAYNFYDAAYQVINDHPCKQGLSPEEFRDMTVGDPDIDKIFCLNNGTPESLYLTCDDLTKLSWVNAGYYAEHYPEKYSKGQVVWFPGIATDKRPEVAGHNSEAIIQFIAELTEAGDNEFTVVFDFCDLNTSWLAKTIEDFINKTPEASVTIDPIATQQYWAVRLAA